jgi:hypothetical protein
MHPAMTTLSTGQQPPARSGQCSQPAGHKCLRLRGLGCWLAVYGILTLALVPVILWAILLSLMDPMHSWRRGRGKARRGGVPHARFA